MQPIHWMFTAILCIVCFWVVCVVFNRFFPPSQGGNS